MSPSLAKSSVEMAAEPVFEVLENTADEAAHKAAWAACMEGSWRFGHGSHTDSATPFWKMDLEDVPAYQTIWEQMRERCEALAGGPLKILRVYANGHTFGQGGQPHFDDATPGTFTLLYYPMPEWQVSWEGETVFYDQNEPIQVVLPKPNRAVLFDSRIVHAGRAPGRAFPGLRVTVAYKLERVSNHEARVKLVEPMKVPEPVSEGALRASVLTFTEEEIAARVDAGLRLKGESVRLPGFRKGHVPLPLLARRYGEDIRREVLIRMAFDAAHKAMLPGGILSSLQCTEGAQSGAARFTMTQTCLPDLPAPDFSQVQLERLTGVDAALCQRHLKAQVLDHLAQVYHFPIAQPLIEREFKRVWTTVESQTGELENREQVAAEFRAIAERRLRLGAVIAEIARRREIRLPEATPAEQRGEWLEEAVVNSLAAEASIQEREATEQDLAELL